MQMGFTFERRYLTSQMAAFAISEADWLMLQKRYVHKLTLEEIGRDPVVGLTRERVRQRLVKVQRCLKMRLDKLSNVLDALEEDGQLLWDPFDEPTSLAEALETVSSVLQNAGWFAPSETELQRVFAVIRCMGKEFTELVFEKWPICSYAVCGLNPPIREHPYVQEALVKLREQEAIWTYRELAIAVLREAQKPMHWDTIAERARQLNRRRIFSPRSMTNMLVSNQDVFVRVSQGTYGLVEWGINPTDTYPDIIFSIMAEKGTPLTEGTIYRLVNSIRPVADASLRMFLDMHPRFYGSEAGTYGLRAWLLPRHKQTLRTPEEFVETPKSFERVANAITRGYDVDGMIERDRQAMAR